MVPVAFAYFSLSNFYEYKKIHKKKNNFWLNDQEKAEYKLLSNEINNSIKFIKNYGNVGNEERLNQNKKELKAKIMEQENILFECNQKLTRFELMPETTWRAYCRAFSNLNAYFFGFITWVITSFFYIYVNFDSIEIGLKAYFQFPFKLFASFISKEKSVITAVSFEVWINMLLIVSVTILAFFIGKLLGRIILTSAYKKPPIINIYNVDSK